MPAKLCICCHRRKSQSKMAGHCQRCARIAGLLLAYKRLPKAASADDPPLGPKPFHRVQAVDMHVGPAPELALTVEREPRTITVGNCEYVVVFSGGDSLYGTETPGNYGSSLLDSSPLRQ